LKFSGQRECRQRQFAAARPADSFFAILVTSWWETNRG